MRKFTLALGATALLFAACKKSSAPSVEPEIEETQAITQRHCAAQEVFEQQLASDPAMQVRVKRIEEFTNHMIQSGDILRLVGDTIEIPVVVHVVYRTNAENISDAQIASQIAVLNEDFQNRNADRTKLPANSFQNETSGGLNVRFVLAETKRVSTKTRSFSTNDAVKSSRRGGSDPVNPATTLNIWACNLGNGLLGYAQFPGGNPDTDGVVCLYSAFGSRAKYSAGTYISRFDLGRTTTHEVGHWMNLRHIWGDDGTGCSGSDLVGDTPNQGGYNVGCPSYPKISCSNAPKGDMFMNYMDYTDDRCMFMFSQGQKARALAVFAAGGPRAAIGQ